MGRAFCDYLAAAGLPPDTIEVRREHIERYLADLDDRVSAATTAKHYRSLQQLFRWLVSDGDIDR